VKRLEKAAGLLYDECARRVGHPPSVDEMHRLFPTICQQYPVLRRIAGVMGHGWLGKRTGELPEELAVAGGDATVDHVRGPGRLRKGRQIMDGTIGTTTKPRRGKVSKRAHRLAKALGTRWKKLTPLERQQLRAEAAAALLQEARLAGKSPAVIEKRLKKAATHVDRLERKAGLTATAATPAPVDPLLKVRVASPAMVSEQPPASTTSDPAALVADLRKSMSQPHDGAGGWRR